MFDQINKRLLLLILWFRVYERLPQIHLVVVMQMEHLLREQGKASPIKILVAMLVGRQLVFWTALNVYLLTTMNQRLKEPDDELAPIIETVDDLVYHRLVEQHIVQQVENVVHIVHLQWLADCLLLPRQTVPLTGVIVDILLLTDLVGQLCHQWAQFLPLLVHQLVKFHLLV